MKTDKEQEWTPQVGDVVEVVCSSVVGHLGRYSIIKIDGFKKYLDGGDTFWFCGEFLKLLIPSKTALAIAGSVRKWLDIVYKGGRDEERVNCPLCQLFVCKECPIGLKTGSFGCADTPYEEWSYHQKVYHYSLTKQVHCPECSRLALNFANWIGDLLPETTFNLIKKEYEEFMKVTKKDCESCGHKYNCPSIDMECLNRGYSLWINKTTCPTCKQPLPIKQEYCCEPFEQSVIDKISYIAFGQWTINRFNIQLCPFCGKPPIPPVKENK